MCRRMQTSQASDLGAVACSVDGDGAGQVRCGRLQRLARVRQHQLAHLAGLAEGDGAQPMLHALRLRCQSDDSEMPPTMAQTRQ